MRSAELRNNEREIYEFHVRVGVAAIAVLLAFGVLAARFVFLQIVQHEAYRAKAEDNRISIVPIAPNRGLVLDRNGTVLARNYSGYTLEIARNARNVDQVIDDLSTLIDVQPRDRARFKKLRSESRNAESLPIRSRLTDEEVAKFAANRYRYEGVADIKMRLFRQYPFGDTAAHAIGYMGRINEEDQARLEEEGIEANYRGTDFMGKAGVEASYQDELHGITGFEQVEIDAAGRGIRTLSRTPAQPGNNVALTLDLQLQQVTERAFGDRRGAVVALEPSTGGVLALLSRPAYDPNLFVDGIDPQSWSELNNSPDRPLLNRAINGLYPPGSTFKPFMALAALELGKRTPRSTIVDRGYFEFGGRRFRTASKQGGHGTVDLFKSIVVSSDVYYYQLANDLGIDAIAAFMDQFGFGSRTGIDLYGEAAGVLPSPEWKQKRFRRREQQRWYPGETISIGIGQGYNSYTPIQLAQATATLVNGGMMFKPRVVSYVDNPRTGERKYFEPQLLRRVPLKPEHVDFIKRAMAAVNTEGTGARAFAKAEYTSGGKTGTAQVIAIKQNEKYDEEKVTERHRDHSWFIAFAPVENPRIAVAIIVENGGYGARAAAPIARTMLDYYLLGKLPPPEQAPEDDEAEKAESD